MSTNKMATKADLQEMYQRMLPYLGGMPEVLANKFSKGDMYSAAEKMIGQWVDGKPLYQKVVSLGSQKILTPNTWFETNINLSFVDTLVDTFGLDEPKNTKALLGSVQSNTLKLMSHRPNEDYVSTVIIKYTKTADSPISIGNDTDYSTDEKIIGTWIDGSPIYQKTVQTTVPAADQDTTISISSLGIKDIISIASSISSFNAAPQLTAYVGGGSQGTISISVFAANDTLFVRNISYGTEANKTIYITIQYTKTS